MKRIFFLTLCLFIVACFTQTVKAQTEAQRIELCTKAAGNDATFQDAYPFQLQGVLEGERVPVFRKAIALRKGNRYRFTICTDEESAGQAMLQLYDENKLIGSSYNQTTGREYQSFDFECHKTSAYILFFSIKDGKGGSAVGIVSHITSL